MPKCGDDGVLPARKTGGDAQIMKKVATRLQDFESQITAQLANLQTDFVDGAGGAAGLDTMAEVDPGIPDLDQLKYDVGELKDLLGKYVQLWGFGRVRRSGNNKGEVNHIRRIVLACERDMEDFTAAMDAVNVDLDEMRVRLVQLCQARVDATHSIITSRQRVEATMTAEISTMRLDIGDIQEALKNHDSWMEDVSNTLQQMQEKEENLTEDIINLKNEMNTKLDTKVDNVAWKEANDDLDAAIKTVRDMVSSLRLDVDARRRKVDEILATIRHDITAVETNLEESKAKITSDTDQAVNALNGRIDFTNKDLAATQESLHTTQNSLSDCFNEVAVVRSDLERNVADTEAWEEARLKNDIRQKQRMSGVQGGLGEHKRDILKLREEVNGLTVKSASHEVDIQKNSDAVRKMEKQRNMDEQNWKVDIQKNSDAVRKMEKQRNMDEQNWKATPPTPLQQELTAAHQQLGAQQEITRQPVYAVNQSMWFQQRQDKRKAPSASGSMLGTPLAAESDATMEQIGPDPFATRQATPPEAGQGATLFQPFPVDEETTYSLTAAQMGVNINNPGEVQAWLSGSVTTRGEVLKTIRAYHHGVLRPELLNYIAQVEGVVKTLDDRIAMNQENLRWLASDN
ncbi:hypothetical protein AK812_SmicGene16053 [Symbiodinium microadriaticum]|uniref:Uncharacterized protein n=1 Tax=Symbiodinium microadriaticum TaxID=2951 RepID=A0A1Q9E1A6_SYMMI|nr:hypothetical protein AK812_SmicGene16053 [Symbiodinium microadriaticum]